LGVVGHKGKDVVEARVALLGLTAVPLDPFDHQVEHLRFEMNRLAVGVTSTGDKTGIPQHAQVLGDGLLGHILWCGEFANGRIANREPSHEIAADRISESGEHSRQRICGHRNLLSTDVNQLVDNTINAATAFVN
jgi:hypothetical protein